MANPASHSSNAPAILLCMFCLLFSFTTTAGFKWQQYRHEDAENWFSHGGDIFNRRYAKEETKISPDTVSKLSLKWKFFAGKDITATPAIFDDTLYFTSWNGYIYAVEASSGSLIWEQNVQALTGLEPTGHVENVNWTVARATPAVAGNLLIVGIYGPAVVIALQRSTGKLVWSTRLEDHPEAVITMSGTVFKGGFYIGVSSMEESESIDRCCMFRGSFAKLDIKTGSILWRTFMLPDNFGKLGGYAGAALWGSSPAIDIRRKLVYVATGNLYSAPQSVQDCQAKQNNLTAPTDPNACIEPDNHSNSILALELDSGNIRWYRQLGGYDVWFVQCINLSTPNCPVGPNPDADFGEAPLMLTVEINGTIQDIVVAGQKSGFTWALSRDNGNLIWFTEAGPGGTSGGSSWGSATDLKTVYTNIINDHGKNFTLNPSTKVTTSGGWVAMDARNGEILWSTADPSNATAPAPVTVANGVLFAGSAHPTGPVYALDAKTGKILWSYNTGATIFGGASVSNGCVYVGQGHALGIGVFSPYTAGTSLFAFCLE